MNNHEANKIYECIDTNKIANIKKAMEESEKFPVKKDMTDAYHNATYHYKNGEIERGDQEKTKGDALVEPAKKEVLKKAFNEANSYFDKAFDAYKNGDHKAYKEYMDKGDKIMKDAETKANRIEKAGIKATESREAHNQSVVKNRS